MHNSLSTIKIPIKKHRLVNCENRLNVTTSQQQRRVASRSIGNTTVMVIPCTKAPKPTVTLFSSKKISSQVNTYRIL